MATCFSLFISLFILLSLYVSAEVLFEDGYTVSTVLDGHKLNVNPHSIVPLFGSSDLIVLDSVNSALFTVSFSASEESGIKRLSGNGLGFSDGDLANAMFSTPKSFAVDFKGNVYVADKGNNVIRKISKLGVTTIAGGPKQPGKADGPGRNASFSTDFELAFIPERCTLMICDHGNQLVRQINLKSQDCAQGSHSELGASTWVWALAVGVSCLLGLIIGFAVRPYVTPYEGSIALRPNETWKHYLISQGRQVQMFCFDIRNAVVSSPTYSLLRSFSMLSLSHLSLMFRINPVESRISQSLLDSEVLGSKEVTKSQMYDEQLKDLISFNGGVELPYPGDKIIEQGDHSVCRNGVLSEGHQSIDSMIQANIIGFEELGKEEPVLTSSGLVKRR